ncbi:MAG: DUF4180 domain-containing protein [Eubacteriales bacterium]
MKTTKYENNGNDVVLVESPEKIITDVQSALDFIATIFYETGCSRIALNKEAMSDDFFILSTRLAGDILQKFINYQVKFAIYGDFSCYTSKPLKDFMYESNNGNDIFFTATKEAAVEKLLSAK